MSQTLDLIESLQKAIDAAYTGSAEHGAFFRGARGEYVPNPFMILERLRAAQGKPLSPEVMADALQDRIGPASGKLIHASPIRKGSAPAPQGEQEHCRSCRGLGRVNSGDVENSGDWETCSDCKGSGVMSASAPLPAPTVEPCPKCGIDMTGSTVLHHDGITKHERCPQPPKFRQHTRSCPAYGNYQPPYEECDCGAED